MLGHFSESLVVGRVRLVEEPHGEPPGRAEAGDRGGLIELELDVGHPTAFFLEIGDDLARGPLAVGPVLQVDDTCPRVRAAAFGQDLVTGQRGDRCDFLDLLGDLLEFLGLGVGVLERGARRRLDDCVDDALVLARDEARRQPRVDVDDAEGKAPDDGPGQRAACDDPPQDPRVTPRDLLDEPVKSLLNKGKKREQEADRPPQIIRQISDQPQDRQPDENIQQNDLGVEPLFRMALVSRECGA